MASSRGSESEEPGDSGNQSRATQTFATLVELDMLRRLLAMKGEGDETSDNQLEDLTDSVLNGSGVLAAIKSMDLGGIVLPATLASNIGFLLNLKLNLHTLQRINEMSPIDLAVRGVQQEANITRQPLPPMQRLEILLTRCDEEEVAVVKQEAEVAAPAVSVVMDLDGVEPVGTYRCQFCDEGYSVSARLSLHLRKTHGYF